MTSKAKPEKIISEGKENPKPLTHKENNMSNVKYAPAADVRAFAATRGITVGKRGLLNPEAVEAFNKAHKGKAKYEPKKYVETVEVKAMKVNASGRKTPIKRQVNIAEAREAAKANGVSVGARGRLPLSVLQAHATGQWDALTV